MYAVRKATRLSSDVTRLVVDAPRIAAVRRPGQFVIVRRGPGAERIPLTIADADPAAGTITLIVQAVGKSTHDLVALEAGDAIRDVAGPLGRPTELPSCGNVVCVGGGIGTAVVFPVAQALSVAGVPVVSIVGARTAAALILTDDLAGIGEVVVCTDDGTAGRRGLVTDALAELLVAGGVSAVYAAGPVAMMRAVADLTRPHAVPTTVSVNSIMVDGTGMCGGCRVTVGGVSRFACVDGPDFDGHAVDFDELTDRLTTYRDQERQAMARVAATSSVRDG